MSDQTPNSKQNYIALTATVQSCEVKTAAKSGKPYVTASAIAKIGKEDVPVRIVINDRAEPLPAETFTFVGSLSYEEWSGRDGKLHQVLVVIVTKVEAVRKPANYVYLTVRAVRDGEARYAPNGRMWTKIRGMKGFGKNLDGSWKPSLFLDIKAFAANTADEGEEPIFDDRVPEAMSLVTKGMDFTVKGSLSFEIYKDKACFGVIARGLEFPEGAESEAELVDLGEP